jgi:zinc transporter, ZIP family
MHDLSNHRTGAYEVLKTMDALNGNFWFAFGLTLFAGLSTGIGSSFAFFTHRRNFRFLSWATGFSAGVMLYVSFVEIFPEAVQVIGEHRGEGLATLAATAAFFAGILVILIIDQCVPVADNPHEVRTGAQIRDVQQGTFCESAESPSAPGQRSLHRVGVLTALAIAIHNFPEGLATFLTALHDPALGVAIAIGIALHNIPEGISVAVPIYYATGNKRKAFLFSLLSGLAEPVGAIVGFLVLRPFLSPMLLGCLLAGVAGVMVFISLDELLPTSRAYGKGHDSLYGLLSGMVVMAISLLLLE